MHTAFAEVTAIRYRARTYTNEAERRRTLEDDVRRGLTSRPKSLPPKYFYDTTGSKLFEDITEQPEYYLTRTERAPRGDGAGADARGRPARSHRAGGGLRPQDAAAARRAERPTRALHSHRRRREHDPGRGQSPPRRLSAAQRGGHRRRLRAPPP